MSDLIKKIWDEKIVYQWDIIEVVQKNMQIWVKQKTFEFARRSPWTRLIIINQNKEVLITKERRFELNKFDYRLPWWKVFDKLSKYNEYLKNNWDILKIAKQGAIIEAQEECLIKINKLDLFKISKCWATIQRDLYYFISNDFEILAWQNLELWENIVLNRIWLDEAKKICISENFSEERSAMVLLKYLISNN